MTTTRRLAAILAADVAGYSRLMGADEVGTVQALREHRGAADPFIAEHGGRIVKTTGDGLLIEFGSVVGAVECALALQQLSTEHNAAIAADLRMEWRIGIHIGDVLIEGDDILGDGVNIAARLEGVAEPGGICISEDAFRQVRGKVAAEFADDGEQSLKNIARPLRVYSVRPEGPLPNPPPPAGEGRVGVLPLPDKPSIAVLPFTNMSGDPEQEYFADGMVEEIITALSRIRWLFVIARNSSFTYKGQLVDVKRVGHELGVRYILEGSVRKADSRVRITAQLIDALSSAHVWADRFDGSLADVFDLQDKVATSVAGVIEPALQAAETARSAGRPTHDLTAYDLYLRAYALYLSSARQIPTVLRLLEQAIARDPGYGLALAWAAVCCTRLLLDNQSKDPEADALRGADFARRALEVAGDDPGVLANVAYALAYLGEDIDAMMALVDRALALNPSYARGWHLSGTLRLFAGQSDTAIEHNEAALRLSPRAACYAHMGRLDEAREVVGRLHGITPELRPRAMELRLPEHRELYLSGLRLAAGEGT